MESRSPSTGDPFHKSSPVQDRNMHVVSLLCTVNITLTRHQQRCYKAENQSRPGQALIYAPGLFPFEFQDFVMMLNDQLFISFAGMLPVVVKFLFGFFQVSADLPVDHKTPLIKQEKDDQ